MGRTAYLLMFINGDLQIDGIGVYSEDPDSLTMDHGRQVCVTLLRASGSDFEAAHAAALADFKYRADTCRGSWGKLYDRFKGQVTQ